MKGLHTSRLPWFSLLWDFLGLCTCGWLSQSQVTPSCSDFWQFNLLNHLERISLRWFEDKIWLSILPHRPYQQQQSTIWLSNFQNIGDIFKIKSFCLKYFTPLIRSLSDLTCTNSLVGLFLWGIAVHLVHLVGYQFRLSEEEGHLSQVTCEKWLHTWGLSHQLKEIHMLFWQLWY